MCHARQITLLRRTRCFHLSRRPLNVFHFGVVIFLQKDSVRPTSGRKRTTVVKMQTQQQKLSENPISVVANCYKSVPQSELFIGRLNCKYLEWQQTALFVSRSGGTNLHNALKTKTKTELAENLEGRRTARGLPGDKRIWRLLAYL